MSVSPLQWRSGAAARGRRLLPIAAIGAVLVLLLALAAYLYDHARRDVIAGGVRVDGVNVGGLHEAAALKKVTRDLHLRLNRPVTVRSSGRSWTLSSREAQLAVDVRNMVAQAVGVSREGSIVTRTVRGIFGEHVNRDIPLVARYSHQAVQALAARVSSALDRPPRNAAVLPSATGLREVPGQNGISVGTAQLRARVAAALTGSSPHRTVSVPIHTPRPALSTAGLAARYPAYIIIDRADFRLRFYEHLKLAKTFEIAVGMEGLETPAGLHKIEWKQVNPPWYVPNKAWAGALAGTVVPPGPEDPLKARFMSFEGGAGIHGIDPSEYETIGHDASHGCVRMRIPDVIDLYSRTPVGTPVYVA
jgi:lipoprotein-anchoring transpeptidase ErfK/SrfK